MRRSALVRTLVMLPFVTLLLAQSPARAAEKPGMAPMRGGAMGSMAPPSVPRFPAVKGFAEGQEIYFIHSEASDPKIAEMLTEMMGGSPVLVVPALARAPRDLLVASGWAGCCATTTAQPEPGMRFRTLRG